VAPQWYGALGKQSTCRGAVSLHAVGDTASVQMSWHLLHDDPEQAGHRAKRQLALDLIDEAMGGGPEPRGIVADAGCR